MSDRKAFLLRWLNSKTGGVLRSIVEARTGREIALATILIADQPSYEDSITKGITERDRRDNFNLVQMILSTLNVPFEYDIDSLANEDQIQLFGLVEDLYALDTDLMLDKLETDLKTRLKELINFKEKMKQVAEERDFYFEKLLEVERESHKYPDDDIGPIQKALSASKAQFDT